MVQICSSFDIRRPLIAAVALVLLAESPVVEANPSEADYAQQKYAQLFAEGEYREAADSAKLLISSLLKNPDYDKLVYAEALTQLATAQYYASAYDSARQNFLLAIGVIENNRDRLDSSLVAPLLGLSRNYIAEEQYQNGIKSYKRTLHVHQVNMGLHSSDKTQIIAELSEAYFELGNFSQAVAMQDAYVAMMNRAHPGVDLAQLPSLHSRADMLYRTGDHLRSLNAYRRIVSLIERIEGKRSLKLIPVFGTISELLADHDIVDGENGLEKARRFLRRAVDIAENNEAADPIVKAEAHIMMGDFLSVRSPDRSAMLRSYRYAWGELSKDEQYHARREEMFIQPLLLNPVPKGSPPAMIDLLGNAADPHTAKNGVTIIHYDISKFGRPVNIRIIESVPAERHDYIVKNHVEDFAFRPRLIDGEPVISRDMSFEIYFSYQDGTGPESMKTASATRAVR